MSGKKHKKSKANEEKHNITLKIGVNFVFLQFNCNFY